MARAFRRSGRGDARRFVATLDPEERVLVASLMDQVHDLLEAPDGAPTGDAAFDEIVEGISLGAQQPDPASSGAAGEEPAPRDPALDRLLPTANREDDGAAAEFRRLTEGGLRQRKATALAASAEVLREEDRVALDAGQARAFLTALTDVRLVLGERLGLRTDEDLELLEQAAGSLEADEPLLHALALYDFLTWLQETLAEALLRG